MIRWSSWNCFRWIFGCCCCFFWLSWITFRVLWLIPYANLCITVCAWSRASDSPVAVFVFRVPMESSRAVASYTRDQLFALQPASPRIPRQLRKTLFEAYLWLPARERIQAAARMGQSERLRQPSSVSSRDSNLTGSPSFVNNNINGKNRSVQLSIASFNAQSIRNKTASVLNIIAENNLDSLSLVETWVEPEDVAIRTITPDGFVCVDRPRTQTVSGDRAARGGGVALVFRDSFQYRKLDLDLDPRTFEFLAVMLTSGGVRTLVVTIYRPDGRNNAFYGEFESLLEMIVVYNCNFVILGDVNVHLDVTTDPATKKFSSTVDSFGLRQMVETATHRARHTLDVVLVRGDRSDEVSIMVQPLAISDHSIILIELPVCKPPPVSFNATTRPWKNFDREAFQRELTASVLCSSGDAWSGMSIDDLAESYSSTLASLVDRFAPRIVVKKHHRPITPWFNAVCRAEKRRSRCLERVYRRTRLARDRTMWINQLRSAQLVYQQVQHELSELGTTLHQPPHQRYG